MDIRTVKKTNIILAITCLVISASLLLITILYSTSNEKTLILDKLFKFFHSFMAFSSNYSFLSLLPSVILFICLALVFLFKRDTLIFWWKVPQIIVIYMTLCLFFNNLNGSTSDFIIWASIKQRGRALSSVFLILAVLLEGSLFVLFNNFSLNFYKKKKRQIDFNRKLNKRKKQEVKQEVVQQQVIEEEKIEVDDSPSIEDILRHEQLLREANKPLVFPNIKKREKKTRKEVKVIDKTNNMATLAARAAIAESKIKKTEDENRMANAVSLAAFENIKKEFEAKEREIHKQNVQNKIEEKESFVRNTQSKKEEKVNQQLRILEEQKEETERLRRELEEARKEKERLEEERRKEIKEARKAAEKAELEKLKAIEEARKKERELKSQTVLPVVDNKINTSSVSTRTNTVKEEVKQEEKDDKPSAYLLNEDAFRKYKLPTPRLLEDYPYTGGKVTPEIQEKGQLVVETLADFNIEVKLVNTIVGPTVTLYELEPIRSFKLGSINSCMDNLKMALKATHDLRILTPIPGKDVIGIEVANKERPTIGFKTLIKDVISSEMELPCVLGKDITGTNRLIDLATTPHLLVAGATGSGKSVCINSLLTSLLYCRTPAQVKLILVDPKVVELCIYNDIPHLLTPVITEPKKAIKALEWAVEEMERRYALLAKLSVRNIKGYNKKISEGNYVKEKLPYIVFVIDEFADIMATSGNEIETNVARIAAKARAVGIHLILATQRPDKNVVTGLIKSNLPTKISFMVGSMVNSRIIIDEPGAEKLLGRGDMLLKQASQTTRIQGCFLSDEEISNVVEFVKKQGSPEYLDESVFEEELPPEDTGSDYTMKADKDEDIYIQAVRLVVAQGKASVSMIQRHLSLGFGRAARLVDRMEADGIIGPNKGSSKPREVLRVPEELLND